MSAVESWTRRVGAAVAMLVLAGVPGVGAAEPEVVAALAGSWGGSGRITYTDGSSEGINCSAYYTGAGNELRMAIQCRSDKNPIHIRSRLRIDGKRATGDWEERTFNASGTASGTAGGGSLSLSVSGGAFSGTMQVSYSKSSHSVTISTKGIAMSRATMQMSRR
ncbi:MAG: hypothetical protein AB7O57_07045 [Hyphomicrobiaceae bacterium]